jgi:hypothetical protein
MNLHTWSGWHDTERGRERVCMACWHREIVDMTATLNAFEVLARFVEALISTRCVPRRQVDYALARGGHK